MAEWPSRTSRVETKLLKAHGVWDLATTSWVAAQGYLGLATDGLIFVSERSCSRWLKLLLLTTQYMTGSRMLALECQWSCHWPWWLLRSLTPGCMMLSKPDQQLSSAPQPPIIPHLTSPHYDDMQRPRLWCLPNGAVSKPFRTTKSWHFLLAKQQGIVCLSFSVLFSIKNALSTARIMEWLN